MKYIISILGFLLSSHALSNNSDFREPPELSHLNNPTAPISVVNPMYPRIAAINNISGWVHLEFDINENGQTENIIILDSYPGDIFIRVAITSIKQWVFPKYEGGESKSQYVMEFKLEN